MRSSLDSSPIKRWTEPGRRLEGFRLKVSSASTSPAARLEARATGSLEGRRYGRACGQDCPHYRAGVGVAATGAVPENSTRSWAIRSRTSGLR